jgi:large-conductance mechanosensitive channel
MPLLENVTDTLVYLPRTENRVCFFENVIRNICRLLIIATTLFISRSRKEMEERLKKEEEERIARRKRVEAIMLRTRGKGSTPSSTPTKVLIFNIIVQPSVYN